MSISRFLAEIKRKIVTNFDGGEDLIASAETVKTLNDTTVKLTGDQSIEGVKTFDDGISFGDDVFNEFVNGVFTPTDESGAGLTFTSVIAEYLVVNNFLFGILRVDYPVTSNTNNSNIGGLPEIIGSGVTGFARLAGDGGAYWTQVEVGNNRITVRKRNNDARFQNNELSGQRVQFVLMYEVGG
jgi:hypothetical protein